MERTESLYDQDSTIFSPDGRLFQVEYARETVKKGALTIGLKFKNGVLLMAYKDITSRIVETNSIEKISNITDSIACAFTGLSADARHLIEYSQIEAQINKIWYGEEISIKYLVKKISEYKQLFTTFTGLRPFGVVLFIAGIDSTGPRLFTTDPSGAFIEYKAVCEGIESDKITTFFEKNYKENISYKATLNLGFKAIIKIYGKKIDLNNLEVAFIEKDKTFKNLEKNEIKEILKI